MTDFNFDNSPMINAALDIAQWTADKKTDLLTDIADNLDGATVLVDIPGYGNDIDIGSVGGVVMMQDFLQKCANLIEEAGQTLGLSNKEVKEIKQMLGMV